MKNIFILILAFCCTLVGCSQTGESDIPTETEEEVEFISIEDSCIFGVYDFEFPDFQVAKGVQYVSDEEKELWREPLVSFLSAIDPYDRDVELYMKGSDGIGLLDANGDGQPEILEWARNEGTGMSSNLTIYNLNGDEIGNLRTGWYGDVVIKEVDDRKVYGLSEDGNLYGNWSVYVNEEGEPTVFSRYNLGNMINSSMTEHYHSTLRYDVEGDFYYDEISYYWSRETQNRYAHSKDMNTMVHIYIDYGFFFNKDYKTQVSVTEVNDYFGSLVSEYKLVADSQLVVIQWEDIEGYDTLSKEELAEKMADLLLNSKQKFLKTEK